MSQVSQTGTDILRHYGQSIGAISNRTGHTEEHHDRHRDDGPAACHHVNEASDNARQNKRCILPKRQVHVLVSRRAHRHKFFGRGGVNTYRPVEVCLGRAHF